MTEILIEFIRLVRVASYLSYIAAVEILSLLSNVLLSLSQIESLNPDPIAIVVDTVTLTMFFRVI